MKSEDVGLIVQVISFQHFQPVWPWSTIANFMQQFMGYCHEWWI